MSPDQWKCKTCGVESTFALVTFQPSGSTHTVSWCPEHAKAHKKRILLSNQQDGATVAEPIRKTPEEYMGDSALKLIATLREIDTAEAKNQLRRIFNELEE